MVKRLSSFAAHSPAFARLVEMLEKVDRKEPNLLQVLTYHDVKVPEAFDQQMAYLAANYHVVSMPELLATYQRRHVLPPRSILITFDDALSSFANCAWPILKRYHLPVTLFVPTAFPDQPERTFWWERLQHALQATERRDKLETPLGSFSLQTVRQREQAFRRLRQQMKILPHEETMQWVEQIATELDVPPLPNRVLGWAALRQLASEGVILGAHTQTHPLMNYVSPEFARVEATESLRDLQREIGSVLPIFAYPNGGFNNEVVNILRQEGFALAFTTVRGTNDLRQADPLRLRRNNIGEQATLTALRTRLLQSSIYFNRLRPLADIA